MLDPLIGAIKPPRIVLMPLTSSWMPETDSAVVVAKAATDVAYVRMGSTSVAIWALTTVTSAVTRPTDSVLLLSAFSTFGDGGSNIPPRRVGMVESTNVSTSSKTVFTIWRSFKTVWTSSVVILMTVVVAAGTMTATAFSTAPIMSLRLDLTDGTIESVTSVMTMPARD